MRDPATTNTGVELQHLFPAGDTVRYKGVTRYMNAAEGAYEIIGLLPARDGEPQYRIKSAVEGTQRVVRESELEKA
jgi:hypothetical protein